MINITPDPVFLQLGSLPLYWYGIAYAVGLALAYWVLVGQARRFGQDPELIGNGIIVIAVAALIGGRLYHVVDQWQNLYASCPVKALVPITFEQGCSGAWRFSGFSGLGVYGGLVTGIIAFVALVRYHRVNAWIWADIAAPALFTMQAVGRWGNFFNQELYGPPTNLPWGIAIDCAHRVAAYPCSTYPLATTGFHPLFLYESISGVVGALFLIWLSRRRPYPLRPGDQVLIFFIWYAAVRFSLENLRSGNWVIGGIATAQIMSILFALGAFLVLLYRHRRPAATTGAGDSEDDGFDEVLDSDDTVPADPPVDPKPA
ncbi:MAG: prolipoprotein diacylglyceryl transferase [Chloroflexi bacterium]|nr:prolipoprotein diacylglyceryl transferase [Chloroflexota bacterium]